MDMYWPVDLQGILVSIETKVAYDGAGLGKIEKNLDPLGKKV